MNQPCDKPSLQSMGDSPCWPQSHDANCESIEVDIGVGNMHSPCGCEVRWYQRALRELSAPSARKTIGEPSNEYLLRMMDVYNETFGGPLARYTALYKFVMESAPSDGSTAKPKKNPSHGTRGGPEGEGP